MIAADDRRGQHLLDLASRDGELGSPWLGLLRCPLGSWSWPKQSWWPELDGHGYMLLERQETKEAPSSKKLLEASRLLVMPGQSVRWSIEFPVGFQRRTAVGDEQEPDSLLPFGSVRRSEYHGYADT